MSYEELEKKAREESEKLIKESCKTVQDYAKNYNPGTVAEQLKETEDNLPKRKLDIKPEIKSALKRNGL